MRKGVDYMVVAELPEEQRKPLDKWLSHQTRPRVDKEGANAYECCWTHDYLRWCRENNVKPIEQ